MLLMIAPAVLFFIVFNYLPMAGIILAFKEYTFDGGILGSEWTGFDNFKFLFLTSDIIGVTRNTILYNIAFIIVNVSLQVTTAIILAELTSKIFKKLTQTMMFLPYFISWVVVGAFAYNLFGYETGFVNSILKSLHMEPFNFYDKPMLWIAIIILFNAWKGLGYGTVIYLAAIMGIDSEMYEAAQIDGATIFQRIRHITLPCIVPTIVILILLSLGNIFRGDFNMFYQLVGENSVVWSTTDVIDTFVTRSLLVSNEIGMPAAAGLLQSVFGFGTIMLVNFLVKRYDKEYALF